ncbi:MAG: leucine-rich repeat domain-containing protein, partial [Acinetobacter sp.]
GTADGSTGGNADGSVDASTGGNADGTVDGSTDNKADGSTGGNADGTVDGGTDNKADGSADGELQPAVKQLIAKIEALPNADEITDENREAATADFEEVWKAYEALFLDETVTDLDGQLGADRMAKLKALRKALLDMVNLVGEEIYAVYDGEKFWAATVDAPKTSSEPKTEIADKFTINHLYVKDATNLTMSTYPAVNNTLKTVTFADTVKTIGTDAFTDCDALTKVELPKVTSIGQSAFYDCLSLQEAIMPEVITIEREALTSCQKLTNVEMPKVTSIGAQAFYGCEKLANITLGAIPPTVNVDFGGAFGGFSPATRSLTILGNSEFATDVLATYDKADSADGITTDNLWYGWTLPTAITESVGKGTLEITRGKADPMFGEDNMVTFTATFEATAPAAAKANTPSTFALPTSVAVEFKDNTTNSLGTAEATKDTNGN